MCGMSVLEHAMEVASFMLPDWLLIFGIIPLLLYIPVCLYRLFKLLKEEFTDEPV